MIFTIHALPVPPGATQWLVMYDAFTTGAAFSSGLIDINSAAELAVDLPGKDLYIFMIINGLGFENRFPIFNFVDGGHYANDFNAVSITSLPNPRARRLEVQYARL